MTATYITLDVTNIINTNLFFNPCPNNSSHFITIKINNWLCHFNATRSRCIWIHSMHSLISNDIKIPYCYFYGLSNKMKTISYYVQVSEIQQPSDSRQSACRNVDVGHKPSSKLPALSTRPLLTFPSGQHHWHVANTKLYCLVQMHWSVVLGRSSKRNRKLNILAAMERIRNCDISRAKWDFDHTHFRCCTISVVRSQAISSVRTVQQSRQSMERADNNGRGGERASTGQLDYGHCRVIS